jgi:hypothetical protein
MDLPRFGNAADASAPSAGIGHLVGARKSSRAL